MSQQFSLCTSYLFIVLVFCGNYWSIFFTVRVSDRLQFWRTCWFWYWSGTICLPTDRFKTQDHLNFFSNWTNWNLMVLYEVLLPPSLGGSWTTKDTPMQMGMEIIPSSSFCYKLYLYNFKRFCYETLHYIDYWQENWWRFSVVYHKFVLFVCG